MDITFDLDELVKIQEAIRRQPDVLRTELLTATKDADLLLQGELQQTLPRGAGGAAGLAGSVATREQLLQDQVIGLVYTDKPYAPVVEFGRRPGPISASGMASLMDWVQAKLGISGDRELRSVTYLVARKIRTRGSAAQPRWREAWESKRDEVARKFGLAVERVLEAFRP